MKKAFAAFLLLIIILSFPINIMAQGYVPAENEQLVDKVVAVVGDQIILLSDLRQQINNLMLAKNMDLNTPEHILQSLFREVLQDMINERTAVKVASGLPGKAIRL